MKGVMAGRWMFALALCASASLGSLAAPPPLTPPGSLSFSEALRYVGRAQQIAHALTPGELRLQDTPQGPRRVLNLNYQGQAVTFVYLDGAALADRALVPSLPDASGAGSLSASQLQSVQAQLKTLGVSGLVQQLGPQLHCYLLLAGRVVAELHFDSKGKLLSDLGPPGKGRPPGPPMDSRPGSKPPGNNMGH